MEELKLIMEPEVVFTASYIMASTYVLKGVAYATLSSKLHMAKKSEEVDEKTLNGIEEIVKGSRICMFLPTPLDLLYSIGNVIGKGCGYLIKNRKKQKNAKIGKSPR